MTVICPPCHVEWVLGGLLSVLLALATIATVWVLIKLGGAAVSSAALSGRRVRRPYLHRPHRPSRITSRHRRERSCPGRRKT